MDRDEYIRRLVDAAPPLSPDQAAMLRRVLAPAIDETASIRQATKGPTTVDEAGERLDDWPDDDYPGGWFGASWDAPVCDDSRHLPTPVGEPCMDCHASIIDGDQGLTMPHYYGAADIDDVGVPSTVVAMKLVHIHIDCFRRGSPNASKRLNVEDYR